MATKEKLSAAQELERIDKAIETARGTISALQSELEGLNKKRDDLIVENALSGSLGEDIQEVDADILKAQKSIEDQNKIISALEGKLKDFQKAQRIEHVIKNDVEAYLDNQGEFLNLAEHSITTDGLVEAVGVLEKEINALWGKNKKRLQLSRDLYNFMNQEGLDRLTEVVDRGTLKGDREIARKYYPRLDGLADEIIDLKEKLNDLQLLLFNVTTMEIGSTYGEKYMLEDPPPPDTEEICDCGKHKRIYKSRDNQWVFFEYIDHFPHGEQWVHRSIDGPGGGHGFENRPGFPCEPVKEPLNGNNGSAQTDVKDSSKKNPDMAGAVEG